MKPMKPRITAHKSISSDPNMNISKALVVESCVAVLP